MSLKAAKILAVTIALVTAGLLPGIAKASELVMFSSGGCIWCARWDREVGTIYDKTTEAKVLPLRRIDIGEQSNSGVKLAEPIRFTPTFVVVEDGHEIGRITGFINDAAFWGLLDALAAKLEPKPSASKI